MQSDNKAQTATDNNTYLQLPPELEYETHVIDDRTLLDNVYECWRQADMLGLDTEYTVPIGTTNQAEYVLVCLFLL
jgi:hypothetical protein